jgi:hypothetical protein
VEELEGWKGRRRSRCWRAKIQNARGKGLKLASHVTGRAMKTWLYQKNMAWCESSIAFHGWRWWLVEIS